MTQERINAVLQQAILSLCKVNYSNKIEIDGIICISSPNTKQQDVVKIHQTIEPQQSAPSNQTLVESALALSLGANKEKSVATGGSVEELTTAAPSTTSSETPGTAKKTPKGRKRNRKVQDDDPDFSSKAKTDNKDTAETEGTKKLRRSTKKSKVSYAEASPVDSEMSDFTEDYVEDPASGNERYGLPDTTAPGGPNVSFGSASVLLKLLADPRAKKMGKQGKKSMLDTVLKGSGLLSGLRQEVLPLTQTSQQVVPGGQTRGQENHTGDVGDFEAGGETFTVKEEPMWDEEYETAHPSQSGEVTSNDKHSEHPSGMDMANANKATGKSNLTDGTSTEGSPALVKAEPEWDEAEYGSPAGSMFSSSAAKTGGNKEDNSVTTGKDSQGKEGMDRNKSSADSRKSILMNILKGPPIVDSYLQKQKPGVYVETEENSDSRESLPKSSASEQDNSLLYRLPYASFSELLFPHSSKNILLSDAEKGERQLSTIDYLSNLQQTQNKVPILSDAEKGERQLSTKDYLANVQHTQGKSPGSKGREHHGSGRGRYKTRLKSGTTDPVKYKDLVGASDNLPGEDVDEALKESNEDVYIPEVDPYEAENHQIQSDSSTRRKSRPKPLCAKFNKGRWEVSSREEEDLDNDIPANQGSQLGTIMEGDVDSVWAGTYFRCKICTRIFADRASRDQHEEEERQTLQAHQCPICDGFFGSEETKSIHMEERHGIQTLTPEQRATILQKMGRNTPYNKRKPYTTKRYQTPSEKTSEKPKQTEREVSTVKDNGPEKVPENDPEAVEVKTEEEDADDKKIECSFCEMLFENEESKTEHLISFHGVSSEQEGNVYS